MMNEINPFKLYKNIKTIKFILYSYILKIRTIIIF